ncbi:5'-deoxynucleotidase [Paenibacillus sp. FSL M7-1455]|uniref:5'-deoxynucleotidase n=2 Tax=Paenibacillus TaxID=44249 RepID=A0ABQ4M168_9BACL|nr:5'-deoxynucleotidase [Paenibacillus cookii]KHF36492.1 5'-deoxynucleotidase YfbR [Paenibacillus sp. P1XP2]GIO69270.1 5'-deoxynucleotidase [Paenibacillus cookii]
MDFPMTAYLYRLQYIRRWSLMRNTRTENVAEHSFHVSLLTHLLCLIGNTYFGRNLNADRAATLALYHDAVEVFTGDIATPVKHNNPQLLASFREMESIAAQRLAAMAPPELQGEYAALFRQDSGDEEQRRLLGYVKAADSLDAYLKCALEVASGNREFAVAKEQTLAKIKQLQLPEADYFLEHMAPSFDMSLDELSQLVPDSE